MARTAADTLLLLQVVVGYDAEDPSSVDRAPAAAASAERPVRVGVPRRFFCEDLQPAVESEFEKALNAAAQSLGWSIEEIDIPLSEHSLALQYGILVPESAAAHDQLVRDHIESYGPDVRAFLEFGHTISAVDYLRAQRARSLLRRGLLRVLADVDIIATPTTPSTAPLANAADPRVAAEAADAIDRLMRNCIAFGQAGVPAVRIPCGRGESGLPIGLQLATRPFGDYQLLAHAARLERLLSESMRAH